MRIRSRVTGVSLDISDQPQSVVVFHRVECYFICSQRKVMQCTKTLKLDLWPPFYCHQGQYLFQTWLSPGAEGLLSTSALLLHLTHFPASFMTKHFKSKSRSSGHFPSHHKNCECKWFTRALDYWPGLIKHSSCWNYLFLLPIFPPSSHWIVMFPFL